MKLSYKLSIASMLIYFLFSSNCMAQSEKSDKNGGIDLPNGFRFGYQWGNLSKDSKLAANNLDRGYIGYVRKIRLVPFVHLETGLEYMITGAQKTNDNYIQLQYIVCPVQGVVKIGPFVGLAGVNGLFKVAETQKLNGNKIALNSDNRSSAFDLTLDAGLGFNILFVTIEARYYWGMLNVNDGWHNRYWEAGLKLHF